MGWAESQEDNVSLPHALRAEEVGDWPTKALLAYFRFCLRAA